jgi:hypothetical protein
MPTPRQLAEAAFNLHEEGHITREELVNVLQQCINVTALENGYAEKYGLPFPEPTTTAPKQQEDRA